MNLETALQHTRRCREQMDALYQKPVFDEWVIVSMEPRGVEVRSYEGPRQDTFQRDLHADSAPLAGEMEARHYAIGDFEFVQDASGARFDACIRLGETCYLFCNNTEESMAELRQDPRWLKAQKPFVDLTERFRADPLA